MKASYLLTMALAAFGCSAANTAAQPQQSCVRFTVTTEDRLHNVKQGLSPDDLKWFREKMAKKYPGACYADPSPDVSAVFYIRVTPDTYHGTRVVTDSSTQSNPISGTITDQSGNTAQISGTQETTTTTSAAVPYSFEYGIFTLSVERRQANGTYLVMQTFQQRGIYNTYMGIPLGGRGHHPGHAVIEDAAKWVNSGGLAGPTQGSAQTTPSMAVIPNPSNPSQADGADVSEVEKSALQGNANGENLLGLLYEGGRGLPQDYTKAGYWYAKAADQGNTQAELNLGLLYEDGRGVPQDYSQAASWFRRAGEGGDPDAQYQLGFLSSKGLGIKQDYGQAAAWYRRAADQGMAVAQGSLGFLYAMGQGVPKDFAQAALWLRKSAEQGNKGAQEGLGLMAYNGDGVPQNYSEAYFWFDLAAANRSGSGSGLDAVKYRDLAASHLSPADLSQSQQRASQWFAAHRDPQ